MSEELTLAGLKKIQDAYLQSEKDTVLRHALAVNKMSDTVTSLDGAKDNAFTFSLDLKTLPVTNQLHSGRCWIFSASNLLREMIAKKAGIKDMFEISQNYISFYDKLEKINFTLEAVISLLGNKPDERKLMFVLQNGVGDGGQWDMFVAIVKKYGVCPKAAFPETAQSNETRDSNTLINASIRKFAAEAQALYKQKGTLAEVRKLKEEYLVKLYALLTDSFGVPPEKFDFEYTDKDGIYHIEKDLTPESFFEEYIGASIDDYVSVINAPTADKPYNQTYQIELLGNVIGGKSVTHLNVSLDRFKEMIVSQLKDKELVWFGSDVSYFGKRDSGLWDDRTFDYQTAFGLSEIFSKKDMLDYHAAAMNHAMVLTGLDEKDGQIVRWKIENSWGEANGIKGMFMMSASFFDAFAFQAAILKKYLTVEELKALQKKPVLLPPWDPFGTLAD
jgi:bleomycin hydrolase